MKKIFLSIIMLLPVMAMAQNEWVVPQSSQATTPQAKSEVQKAEKQAKAKTEKVANKRQPKEEDIPYLKGAVPEVDGKVVYSLDIDLPGKSAAEIYDIAYAQLEKLAQDEHQTGKSKIALVNKNDYSIVATYSEWLVFADKLLMLDRTQFTYIAVAKCTDGKLHIDFERINYQYELNRRPQYFSAEESICDKVSLSKNGTKLVAGYIKFRKKTVDRMNEILDTFRANIK